MSSEKDNILKFSRYMKSDKMPYIIYVDAESLIEKVDGSTNNPEKSSTTKIHEHLPCGYSKSTTWAFDHIENKRTLYGVKGCIKTVNKGRIKIRSRCKRMLHL